VPNTKRQPLKIDLDRAPYRALVGVGGIGAGTFFLLNGDHTLGREESRGGRFSDRRDYCKLHIIAHYAQLLLGKLFTVIPIGKVGEDDVGRRLYGEMAATGMRMDHVSRAPGAQTLFSFCFIYPDGSGGNMTTDDSAAARVDRATIEAAAPDIRRFARQVIVLAAPEAPLEARRALLELGTAHGALRIASFTSAEIPEILRMGLLRKVDLLAVNLDEAAALASAVDTAADAPEAIVAAAVARAREIRPAMVLSVTAGRRGSWYWDGRQLTAQGIYPAQAVSTAGAGDAYLGGLIVGLVAGLAAPALTELAALIASHAVTSPHTIDDRIERGALRRFAQAGGVSLSPAVQALLEE
jgi:ribokinase